MASGISSLEQQGNFEIVNSTRSLDFPTGILVEHAPGITWSQVHSF